MAKRPRNTMIGFRCTDDEAEEIERYATREDLTTSEFVRVAVLGYMAMRGSRLALKRIGEGVVAAAEEFVARWGKSREQIAQ